MNDAEAGELVDQFPRGWIAFHDVDEDDEDQEHWHFVPKQFWEEHGHMPDTPSEPEVPNFCPVMEYVWETDLSDEEATNFLIEFGLEIIENPIWWWDR